MGYQVSTRSQPGRGTFQWSNYRDFRFQTYFTTFEGATPDITVREARLLHAEGLYLQGNLAGAAAIVNESRVANGELPPVTTAGVPASAGCVPKLANGTCGDLWAALKWEKRVEIWMHYLGDWFFDSRAWGMSWARAPRCTCRCRPATCCSRVRSCTPSAAWVAAAPRAPPPTALAGRRPPPPCCPRTGRGVAERAGAGR